MRSFDLRKVLLAALVLLPTVVAIPTAAGQSRDAVSSLAAERAIAESINAALQGDSRRSIEAMKVVPAEQFVGQDAQYRACMIERFGRASPPDLVDGTGNREVDEILSLYQRYWWRALASPPKLDELDRELQQQLLARLGETTDDWDELEAALTRRLRKHGYYAQPGRTPPLRELMVWREQTSKPYDVDLPEGSHRVRVELLDDFVSRGWSSYARCGRGSSGGWATADRLYAVMPWLKGNLESDEFRASLLGHETQHLADLQRFPDLESWELEYRAKFTELWKATDTLPKLLAKFASSQSDDKSSPHTYANKRVLSVLRERLQRQSVTSAQPDLGDVPPDVLRAAAREQLIEDSRQRAAAATGRDNDR